MTLQKLYDLVLALGESVLNLSQCPGGVAPGVLVLDRGSRVGWDNPGPWQALHGAAAQRWLSHSVPSSAKSFTHKRITV